MSRSEPGRGSPTAEEVAAIVAAVDVVYRRPLVLVPDEQPETPVWRFSGRWWARPVAARRDRPW